MTAKTRELLLTVGKVCYSKKAPGTMGTVAGLIFITIFLKLLHLPQVTLFLLAIFITVISIKEIDIFEKEKGEHDSKEIVIDEVVGIMFATSIMGGITYIHLFLAFVFFRVFDIWKPSYIGWIDKNVKGGLGVMGDDILAGIVAGIVTAIVGSLFLLILGLK